MNTFELPPTVVDGAGQRAFGVYIHVPFCAARCGYCDFNTYTNAELGGGADLAQYADTAMREIDMAQGVLQRTGLPQREVSTIFFGGGTPTILPTDDLLRLIDRVAQNWGLSEDVEISVEANPDSITAESLRRLADGGVTRLSMGMQSSVPSVLAVLERTHTPEQVPAMVNAARDVGLEVSLDLIYGTPGESMDQWRQSLDDAIAMHPDHLSAYSLTVEPGTRLNARVQRGELQAPDDDDLANKYEVADSVLIGAGFEWYEISNWAQGDKVCRHNMGYWRSDDWWGIGPGAHSHIGGTRWWNVKHPRAYAQRLNDGLPIEDSETLDEQERQLEDIMLRLRLREGLDAAALDAQARDRLPELEERALIHVKDERVTLTLAGRLLADTVIRDVTS